MVPAPRPSVRVPRPSARADPQIPVPDSLEELGIEVKPLPRFKFVWQTLVSIDWHQACDCIRKPGVTERPVGYQILPGLRQAIQRVRDTFPGCIIILLSYCCAEWFRDGVLSIADLPDNPFGLVATTSERVGLGGKLFFLRQIAYSRSCAICHIDDNHEIAEEFLRATENNPTIHFFGVKVPRHWKEQRKIELSWKRNVLEALEELLTFTVSKQPISQQQDQ